MGSHSMLFKQVMYEESARVPLLLRVPFRNQKPMRITQPVSHIDTVPTLLDMLGKRDVSGLDGRSATAALEGRKTNDSVFLEWNSQQPGQDPNARTVVTPDGWKLVLHDTDRCLLFHRAKDPDEVHNLYYRSDYASVVRRLRGEIDKWQRMTNDKLQLPV